MNRHFLVSCFLLVWTLAMNACAPPSPVAAPTPIPGLVDTLIAQTSESSRTQTAVHAPTATATRMPTSTHPVPASVTSTILFKLETATFAKEPTATKFTLEAWPDWSMGSVVEMPKGSGEGTGVTRYFIAMNGAFVKVVRQHGVKLRNLPTKASGGKLAPTGSFLELTGLWNKNKKFFPNFSFVKVIAADGKEYWVGGTDGEDTDPVKSLVFDLPPTPTPPSSETPTPTLFYVIPPKFPTATPSQLP